MQEEIENILAEMFTPINDPPPDVFAAMLMAKKMKKKLGWGGKTANASDSVSQIKVNPLRRRPGETDAEFTRRNGKWPSESKEEYIARMKAEGMYAALTERRDGEAYDAYVARMEVAGLWSYSEYVSHLKDIGSWAGLTERKEGETEEDYAIRMKKEGLWDGLTQRFIGETNVQYIERLKESGLWEDPKHSFANWGDVAHRSAVFIPSDACIDFLAEMQTKTWDPAELHRLGHYTDSIENMMMNDDLTLSHAKDIIDKTGINVQAAKEISAFVLEAFMPQAGANAANIKSAIDKTRALDDSDKLLRRAFSKVGVLPLEECKKIAHDIAKLATIKDHAELDEIEYKIIRHHVGEWLQKCIMHSGPCDEDEGEDDYEPVFGKDEPTMSQNLPGSEKAQSRTIDYQPCYDNDKNIHTTKKVESKPRRKLRRYVKPPEYVAKPMPPNKGKVVYRTQVKWEKGVQKLVTVMGFSLEEDMEEALNYLSKYNTCKPGMQRYYESVYDNTWKRLKAKDPTHDRIDDAKLHKMLMAVNPHLSHEDEEYVKLVLDMVDDEGHLKHNVSQQAFVLMASLSERVCGLESVTKSKLPASHLMTSHLKNTYGQTDAELKQQHQDYKALKGKVQKAKEMFYFNADEHGILHFDKVELELAAGRFKQEKLDSMMTLLSRQFPNKELTFVDFLMYLPMFVDINQDITENPLENERTR